MTSDKRPHVVEKSADDAREGLLTPQRQRKRPREDDAADPFLIRMSPPAKRRRIDAAMEGEHSLKKENLTMSEKKLVQPHKVSRKRKAPTSEDSETGTFPPAKRAVPEGYYDLPAGDLGSAELGTPQVERPDSRGQEKINHLSPEHLSILKGTGYSGMLDDDIINMAQTILQTQFQDFDGLQPVAALLVPGYNVVRKAVQIHYDEGRMHWLTTCYKDGNILVADSMKNNNLTPSICQQIINMYSHVIDEPLKHLRFLHVDQQRNGYDCGVFAIAFAFDLLEEDGDPTAMYQHEAMRLHLISCLQSGRITAFPKIHQ
ncbi:uncharacterized protein [Dendropsophus ebraccatus]|uniref:uncharacterized protein n=1 Tax=Dendropsophus ebraccatus TaxID=150705 RepID=UPI0038322F9A